jgi:transmembrane sensor
MDHELIEKYFRKKCTPEEAEEVLRWFRKKDGEEYLNNRIEKDIERFRSSKRAYLYPPIKSKKIYRNIRKHTSRKSSNHRYINLFIKIAALFFVILTGSLFYFFSEFNRIAEIDSESVRMVYSTESDEQKVLTLSDETVIRLNENSSLILPATFNKNSRRIELSGEAYFEVKNRNGKNFEIIADEAMVEVLGTEFNVKLNEARGQVQVAVLEGEVALRGNNGLDKTSANLSAGYFGVYHFSTRETIIEEAPVHNYKSWISNHFEYDNEPLWRISRQLEWMYGRPFDFADDNMRDLRLLASFPKDSLEETLNIIATTLEIDYEKDGDTVHWLRKR